MTLHGKRKPVVEEQGSREKIQKHPLSPHPPTVRSIRRATKLTSPFRLGSDQNKTSLLDKTQRKRAYGTKSAGKVRVYRTINSLVFKPIHFKNSKIQKATKVDKSQRPRRRKYTPVNRFASRVIISSIVGAYVGEIPPAALLHLQPQLLIVKLYIRGNMYVYTHVGVFAPFF